MRKLTVAALFVVAFFMFATHAHAGGKSPPAPTPTPTTVNNGGAGGKGGTGIGIGGFSSSDASASSFLKNTTLVNAPVDVSVTTGTGEQPRSLSQDLTLQEAPQPATIDFRNVPNVTAIAPALAALASGGAWNCIGPSETKSAGISAGWSGFGAGASGGDGKAVLDWDCAKYRAFLMKMALCTADVKPGRMQHSPHCDDAIALANDMEPVKVVHGIAKPPAYAKEQLAQPNEMPAPAKTAKACSSFTVDPANAC